GRPDLDSIRRRREREDLEVRRRRQEHVEVTMTRQRFTAAASGSAAVWLTIVGLGAHAQGVDYHRPIEPIVKRACRECHSQDRRRGGLSLATYADALDGGRNGAVIRPGNGGGSPLVHHLTGALDPQMPKDEDPLPRDEIALIRRW